LKHLLILLILYTEKNPQGILASKATEILWPDKEETAARNNRNVNLRKLRVLLESIGDMEVVTENNFLRIKWGTSVFCDYHTLMTCTKQFEQEKSEELLNRILELLLYGPLLPNTVFDWLDDFKDAYSSHSIDLLKNLLEIEIQRNHQEMIIRLADIMFLHDPLNEEALAAKCTVLSAQGKKGIARNVYDRFCKEYRDSMGENYKIPFVSL
jgi:DNA-binding SARP family transcriptional activator